MRREVTGWILLGLGAFLGTGIAAPAARAATPSAAQALQLAPVQKDVDYDRPAGDDAEKCAISAEKEDGLVGWAVRNEAGVLLRRFVDTNKDNKVDLWCYYRGGVEVYRDVDADFNGKADQYRWLGTAGTRWGLDPNEDGQIDTWKLISAEEVSAELVSALVERDTNRFRRLLLTREQLDELGLGEEQTVEVARKIAAAPDAFTDLARAQKLLKADARWLQFGAAQPGLMPAGVNGAKRDLIVYENVVAIADNAGEHAQVPVGTLVQVPAGWRLIDVPKLGEDQVAAAGAGYFFQVALARPEPITPAVPPADNEGIDDKTQKLVTELERVDRLLLASKDPAEVGRTHIRRAEILEELAAHVGGKEGEIWLRQLADSMSAAVQSGAFPAGTEQLKKLADKLADKDKTADITAFVKFRWLTAAYTQSLQEKDADFGKIQEQWLADLEQFHTDFPRSEDAAEAMLQLAIAQEFAGEESQALRWYGRITAEFPKHPIAAKAAGAERRLNCVGKAIPLAGTTIDGRKADLAAYRNKVVLVHYWATWCEPCMADMKVIAEVAKRYGPGGFHVLGVNLDTDRQEVRDYVAKSRLPWPTIYEEGGLDSRLANEMGILTLPTMFLINAKGQVVSRSLHSSQLESEVKKLIR